MASQESILENERAELSRTERRGILKIEQSKELRDFKVLVHGVCDSEMKD